MSNPLSALWRNTFAYIMFPSCPEKAFLILQVVFMHVYAECGGPEKCCAGFMWDKQSGTCVKCRTGYTGPFCNIPCPFPRYGEVCQSTCKCEAQFCDLALGCLLTTEKSSTTADESTVQTTTEAIKRETTSSHSSAAILTSYFTTIATYQKEPQESSACQDNKSAIHQLHAVIVTCVVIIVILLIIVTIMGIRIHKTSKMNLKRERVMAQENGNNVGIENARYVQLTDQSICEQSVTDTTISVIDESLCSTQRYPSENTEYTEVKCVGTHLNRTTSGGNGRNEKEPNQFSCNKINVRCHPCQSEESENSVFINKRNLMRQPCQSVDENEYNLPDYVDDNETFTKEVCKEEYQHITS